MGHVVDEVVLNLIDALLPEYHVDGEDECDKQNQGEDDARYEELDRLEDVIRHVREVQIQNPDILRRVVGHQHLPVTVFLTFGLVVRTAVNLFARPLLYTEVVGKINAVADELGFQVKVKHLEVDVIFKGLFARII